MEQNYVVLQGKVLEVDLQSSYGSSAYGWCLSALPEELILLREDIVSVQPGIGPVIHKFYFGVMSAKHINVEINFVLAAFFDLPNVADTFTAKVRIVPSDAAKYVTVGENTGAGTPFFPVGNGSGNMMADTVNSLQPYGFAGPYSGTPYDYSGIKADTPFFPANKKSKKSKKAKKYRKFYDAANDIRPYGYPCMTADETDGRLYGYPCGGQDVFVKYGYPCGAQDASVKYGYPCGAQDAVLKYGYPCGGQDVSVKYGYPCGGQDVFVKYGYPCGAQDAVLKYGYPCGGQDVFAKYGYPCGAQDAVLKYGYPCGVQDASANCEGQNTALESSCPTQAICDCDGRLYGYPLMAYGYPVVAYGYPVEKYGFPCC